MTKPYHVRRHRNRDAGFDDVDPRQISGTGLYGDFTWAKIDENEALWSFADENKRDKFAKAYGGNTFDTAPAVMEPTGSCGYDYGPDADFGVTTTDLVTPGFFWDRK